MDIPLGVAADEFYGLSASDSESGSGSHDDRRSATGAALRRRNESWPLSDSASSLFSHPSRVDSQFKVRYVAQLTLAEPTNLLSTATGPPLADKQVDQLENHSALRNDLTTKYSFAFQSRPRLRYLTEAEA